MCFSEFEVELRFRLVFDESFFVHSSSNGQLSTISTFNRKARPYMATHAAHIARDRCLRCGGFMVPVEMREVNQMGWRCVMCGEHIDALILEHRRKMETPEGVRQLLEKRDKARLN